MQLGKKTDLGLLFQTAVALPAGGTTAPAGALSIDFIIEEKRDFVNVGERW